MTKTTSVWDKLSNRRYECLHCKARADLWHPNVGWYDDCKDPEQEHEWKETR